MRWPAAGMVMLGMGHLMNAQAACSVGLSPATATPPYSFSTTTPVTGTVTATKVTVTLSNECANNGKLAAQPGNLSATGAGAAPPGGNSINYQLRQTTSNGAVWGDTANTNTISAGDAASFDIWITDRTNSGLLPPGTYTDSVLVTHTNSGGNNPTTNSLPISITAPSHCAIEPISNIVLPYTSFQSAAESSTSFKVYCNVAYNIAVAPPSGTFAGNGLNYSLELNPSVGNQSANLAGTTHTLTGKVSAGQSGTCAAATCQGQSLHTVTVTY